jgi:hypothetical protein
MPVTCRSLTDAPLIAARAVRAFFAAVATGDAAPVAAALHPDNANLAGGWASYGLSLRNAGVKLDVINLYCLGTIQAPRLDLTTSVCQVTVAVSTYIVTTRALTNDEDRVSAVLPLWSNP